MIASNRPISPRVLAVATPRLATATKPQPARDVRPQPGAPRPSLWQQAQRLTVYCAWQVRAMAQGARTTVKQWAAAADARLHGRPVAPPAPARPPARRGFVNVEHTHFVLDGQPFRFVGVNVWGLAGYPVGQIDDAMRRIHEETGAKVVRFMAYQAYTQGGTDFSTLDAVMAAANKYGMKVIPVLENHWETLTQGGLKTEAWYAAGYKQPYGDYKQSFERFAEGVVERYKNEPAVFSWMLMNEAECRNPDTLVAFADTMSRDLKARDPNHLLTLGVLGGHQVGMDFGNYARYAALPGVDYAEYHDYSEEDVPLPGLMASRMADAKKLDKPLLLAESGMSVTPHGGWRVETPESRARKLDAKMDAYFKAEGTGYLVWDWTPDSNTFVDFTTGDPLEAVLKQRAARLGE